MAILMGVIRGGDCRPMEFYHGVSLQLAMGTQTTDQISQDLETIPILLMFNVNNVYCYFCYAGLLMFTVNVKFSLSFHICVPCCPRVNSPTLTRPTTEPGSFTTAGMCEIIF